jgi:hypothetical protein
VECSSRGFCLSEGGVAYCACLHGFHPVGLACEANDAAHPCDGVDCSGHGECREGAREPWCECDPGYHHPAGTTLVCLPDAADGGEVGGEEAGDADAWEDAERPDEGVGEGETVVETEGGGR